MRAAQDRLPQAADCYRRALVIDPAHTPSYVALAGALLLQGERAEAGMRASAGRG